MPDNRGDRGTEGPNRAADRWIRMPKNRVWTDTRNKMDVCMSMVWYETLVKYECIFFPHFRNEVFFKRMV